MTRALLLAFLLVGCGSGGYGPAAEGDGGLAPTESADSGALPMGTGGAAAVPSCGSGPHGQTSACRATGSPYQYSCPEAPAAGCKMATVGSATHITSVYCCALPEYH